MASSWSLEVMINGRGCRNRTVPVYTSELHYAITEGNLTVIEILLDPSHRIDLVSKYHLLHTAASCGQVATVKLLLTKYNWPVDCKNDNKQTSLHLACGNGHLDVVRMLVLEYEADLNARDKNNDMPLHAAARYGHTDIIKYLIDTFRTCNPSTPGCKGRTILHYACYKGHIELVNVLIKKYQMTPSSNDNSGNNSLHYAVRRTGAREKIVRTLTNNYTDLHMAMECRNKYNKSSLDVACSNGHFHIAKLLMVNYGSLKTFSDDNLLCAAPSFLIDDNQNCSLLHLACQQGHINVVEQLVTVHKVDPNIRDNCENTPLHYAALGGKIEIATLLITKYGSPVSPLNNKREIPLHLARTNAFITAFVGEHKADINACDINNHTPLQRAAFNGQIEVVDCFIKEFNCSADSKGTDGYSLLHLACQQGHLELIEHLVTNYKLDSMIQESDNNGNIPLHYAALGGNSEVATLLISKYHSPVNHQNHKTETPLHLACIKGHLKFIQALVEEHKADINAIGVKGRNLLHYACLSDQDDLAQILVNAFNFSLVSTDTDGNSPLHIAAVHGKNKCVHKLLHTFHAPIYLRNGSGKSALEIASDGNTKNIIETYLKGEHDRIQDDYKQIQILSSKKYSGAQRLTRVFVLGHKQSGKSTLIESLKRQTFFSSFKQISEAIVPPHTSGIIPSEYQDKSIGRVLYYDFAGDPEYYSSHSAIMSSVMQSKQGTNVFLMLVNFQKYNKYIFEELGYWFGFISYHCAKLKENSCKVLVIGSHIDLITKQEARRKAALVSEFTHKYFSFSSKVPAIEIVKGKNDLIINCCNPRSSTCVHHTLSQIVKGASTYRLSVEAAIILGLLNFEKGFKGTVTCSVQTLLTHIMETGIHLPNAAESIYPKLMELHNIGLIMVIESKSGKIEDYLLLLNISKLTNEVHKLLFSKDSAQTFPLSIDPHSASMGILPQTYLTSILPEYITTECLIQLQYCHEFYHAEVKLDYSVITTEDFCAPRLLYFPALCGIQRRKTIRAPKFYDYSIGWYVKCCGKFDYLPPRFLHVLLLRLAHTFALPAAHEQPSNPSAKGNEATTLQLYNRRCTMWKNGIHWLMEEGVECYVEMVNNSKGVVIVAKSESVHISTCTEMLFKIIQEIHQAKEEFCGTVTLQEYLVDSDNPAAFTNEDILFATCDIARVL